MKPNNPFLISGYYSPEFFCDRESETNKIIDALNNERNITLIAPRRMGKTGLIKHVFYHLKRQQPEIITFYVDIYSTQSLGDFVKLLANTVLGQLDSAPQKALSRISKFIKSCRPVFTFDGITGMPEVTIDINPNEEVNSLKEIFDYLSSSEKRCYIAIDEFQQIAEYPETGIEALLRSYIQFLPNVNFIFAGSKKHLMQEIFTSSKRPFYQSTQLLNITSIDFEKYAHFAETHFAQNGVTLPGDIFATIYDKYAGHTWYIQNILNRLYSYQRNVDNGLVTYATSHILEESGPVYVDIMKAYKGGPMKLLRAIAREGCVKEVLSGAFISKYELKAASSVSSSLKKLIENELVYPDAEGYIVYDRFMAEWLRSQIF